MGLCSRISQLIEGVVSCSITYLDILLFDRILTEFHIDWGENVGKNCSSVSSSATDCFSILGESLEVYIDCGC